MYIIESFISMKELMFIESFIPMKELMFMKGCECEFCTTEGYVDMGTEY